ncbi:DUF397 domain-containing protein [Streptomyces sp. NPDC085540]|uniref:DUF397 domain-containing protein n=1 Tax=Streptomyces sp. NPDC085540 TaxID=3365730 RepID=UPI0037D75664
MPARKEPDASANVPSFYGAELRYKRETAGLTLDQLAEGSFRGVPFPSQIERGERRMPLDLARHVDVKLGTDGFFERRWGFVGAAQRRKSSYTNGDNGDCVEVGDGLAGVVPVRDSTRPHVPAVVVAAGTWVPFVRALKAGETPA